MDGIDACGTVNYDCVSLAQGEGEPDVGGQIRRLAAQLITRGRDVAGMPTAVALTLVTGFF
jgi:hypothetical protein